MFARFVPDAVVDQVLTRATEEGDPRLGGERMDATVLFSDLRGFTSFAEARDPEQVIDVLNRYLTAMSDAILDHDGTLVAYMGDGIMAVFGAPVAPPDHADRRSPRRAMLERLEQFNAWIRERGLGDGFKMGIGLHSGPVMSGNVGSARRLEYAAIGDTTNTAARLEGMTKGTPYQLFVGEPTRSACAARRRSSSSSPSSRCAAASTGSASGAARRGAAPAAAAPEAATPPAPADASVLAVSSRCSPSLAAAPGGPPSAACRRAGWA